MGISFSHACAKCGEFIDPGHVATMSCCRGLFHWQCLDRDAKCPICKPGKPSVWPQKPWWLDERLHLVAHTIATTLAVLCIHWLCGNTLITSMVTTLLALACQYTEWSLVRRVLEGIGRELLALWNMKFETTVGHVVSLVLVTAFSVGFAIKWYHLDTLFINDLCEMYKLPNITALAEEFVNQFHEPKLVYLRG